MKIHMLNFTNETIHVKFYQYHVESHPWKNKGGGRWEERGGGQLAGVVGSQVGKGAVSERVRWGLG